MIFTKGNNSNLAKIQLKSQDWVATGSTNASHRRRFRMDMWFYIDNMIIRFITIHNLSMIYLFVCCHKQSHKLLIFFFPHNFISPYLHFFVTTRQSSTYKQSTSDSEVRKHDCIRTLVTSYDNETHNNAPKATGNGLKQCGTAITRSIFFKFSQQTTHISPVRARNWRARNWCSHTNYVFCQSICGREISDTDQSKIILMHQLCISTCLRLLWLQIYELRNSYICL